MPTGVHLPNARELLFEAAERVLARDLSLIHISLVVGRTRLVSELECADVARQGVEPDVDDLARIVRHNETPPPCSTGGPRDADVAEPAADEREDLVFEGLRRDQELVRADKRLDVILIGGQTEEPVLLSHSLDSGVVLRATVVDELVWLVERLAADAVAPLETPFVEVPPRRTGSPEAFDRRRVTGVAARLDVVVEGEIEWTCCRRRLNTDPLSPL